MAKIKQGILGGFSGKVANVVGTSWKGRAVMKSQPLSVSNPKTEAQVGQRNKFSKVAELASQILTQFIQPVENPISGDISGYNLFCKDNKAAFGADGALDYSKLVCGGGRIINIPDPTTLEIGDTADLDLSWTNAGDESAIRLTDKVFAVGIDLDKDVVLASKGTETRSSQKVGLWQIAGSEAVQQNDEVAILFACVSADGREVSLKTAAVKLEVSL